MNATAILKFLYIVFARCMKPTHRSRSRFFCVDLSWISPFVCVGSAFNSLDHNRINSVVGDLGLQFHFISVRFGLAQSSSVQVFSLLSLVTLFFPGHRLQYPHTRNTHSNTRIAVGHDSFWLSCLVRALCCDFRFRWQSGKCMRLSLSRFLRTARYVSPPIKSTNKKPTAGKK